MLNDGITPICFIKTPFIILIVLAWPFVLTITESCIVRGIIPLFTRSFVYGYTGDGDDVPRFPVMMCH